MAFSCSLSIVSYIVGHQYYLALDRSPLTNLFPTDVSVISRPYNPL